jgi:predicted nucleotidyltransferase
VNATNLPFLLEKILNESEQVGAITQMAVFRSIKRVSKMVDVIKNKLDLIERENTITVLYACESGSRAWGFASPDSDYDVRFIYARQPNDYLSITGKKDVMEYPVSEELDISGWDLRKALQLFLKSNAPLYEWLQSPIVYKKNSRFINELTSLIPSYFSLRAGCHHYYSMARNTFEKDLISSEVKLKKYCYALRSALAGLWIVEKKELPPMEFGKLRLIVENTTWQSTIDSLMELKKANDEKSLIMAVPLLQEWIEETLLKITDGTVSLPDLKNNTGQLDNIFRKYIHPPIAG